MKIFTFLFCLICSFSLTAQTTAVPDSAFEQALIDLDIDSDMLVNGQVLTSDINSVTNLTVSSYNIQDLTGIEDFAALVELDVSGNQLNTINLTGNANLKILKCDDVNGLATLNLSGNPQLEELYCSSVATDVITLVLNSIDLSNNPNIEKVVARNTATLTMINLSNGNNANMESLQLDLYFEGWPGGDDNKQICIQVDDETAAQQNQYPYSTWVIDDYNITYSFSEACSLGIEAVEQNNIQIFPNPVRDFLQIENPNNQIGKIEVYNLRGKKLKSFSKNRKRIDMQGFAIGVYFLKIYSEQGISTKKIEKE